MTRPRPTAIVPSGSGFRSVARSRSRRVCKTPTVIGALPRGRVSRQLRSFWPMSRSRLLSPLTALATLLVGLTTAAVAPPAAGAAPAPIARGYGASVTLSGHGFGHGIGMSQVGAYGYAV